MLAALRRGEASAHLRELDAITDTAYDNTSADPNEPNDILPIPTTVSLLAARLQRCSGRTPTESNNAFDNVMTASTAAASTSTTSAASGLLLLDNGTWKFAELPGKPLPNWPALRVVNHPKRGRYLIAARPLKAGECVLKEEPFVQTVHDDLQDTVCHYCYSVLPRSGAPSPCADCGHRFCSRVCNRVRTDHAIECGLLTQIRGNATARKGVRGLRLFVHALPMRD